MTAFDFDLFVIGAGSGGVRASRIAASHGARVGIAEGYRVGGTCVIRGCVPKKLMVYASRFHGEFEDAAGFGWTVGTPTFDWGTLIANKDKEIDRLERAYQSTLDRWKVETFREHARIDGPGAVKLASGRRVTAKHILIATGGRPETGTFPGAEHCITSNEVFHLERQPKRVVVLGGGYIALEFAGVFAGLGSKTTVVYRGEKILRGFDEDLRDDLSAAMGKRGVEIRTRANIARVDKSAGALKVTLTTGETLEADCVLVAIGRTANTEGLGLETVDIVPGRSGEIATNDRLETSVPGIYAVGDVRGHIALTPVAIREGHAFADTVFGSKPWTVDYDMIPTAVFSEPEIGTVGLSEADARRTYGEVDIYKARFRPMKYTLAGRDERMLMKLVVDQKSQRVVGCHVMGPDAAEMVQMAAIAMRMKATKADFDATMALHPSAAEELVTMREKWVPPKA
ncbi:MAG TPA: glutathione-disulfide reductase [Hyphomicrobiaceae bacterium]|nr:glutathione-disulfide reductase [Hyphomicrobiaceae bacterium]